MFSLWRTFSLWRAFFLCRTFSLWRAFSLCRTCSLWRASSLRIPSVREKGAPFLSKVPALRCGSAGAAASTATHMIHEPAAPPSPRAGAWCRVGASRRRRATRTAARAIRPRRRGAPATCRRPGRSGGGGPQCRAGWRWSPSRCPRSRGALPVGTPRSQENVAAAPAAATSCSSVMLV